MPLRGDWKTSQNRPFSFVGVMIVPFVYHYFVALAALYARAAARTPIGSRFDDSAGAGNRWLARGPACDLKSL